MNRIGRLEIISEEEQILLKKDELKPGINNLKDHIVKYDSNEVAYVVDKICNHAGGRLIVKEEEAICPMHGWQLDLNTLKYSNDVQKEGIPYTVNQQGDIEVKSAKRHLTNSLHNGDKKGEFKFRWINHATVYIECNGISLITDPWLFGPAFMTGWWLIEPSPKDSIDLLKNADYIYISHNHPDHLHPETLDLIPKNKPIIVGNFKSRSTEKYLKALGFTEVSAVDFAEIFELTPDFQISVLKSGDFRDDSGLYINANNNQLVLTVDCNFLNAYILPKNIDLLMTSFAAGASGFPLCFNNYNEEEKTKILNRNKQSIRISVRQYLKSTRPSYYIPYAGMFKEYSQRDEYIKDYNLKNAPEDFRKIAAEENASYVEPRNNIEFQFKNGKITEAEIDVAPLKKEDTQLYVDTYKEDFPYNAHEVINYLENSNFHKNQIIQIIPTNDDYNEVIDDIVYADFGKSIFKVITPSELVDEVNDYRVMKIYVRKEIIACVIENKLPWEDFSIGFQMRVERHPNEYESDFWYHFTNNYINQEHFRYSSYCGACTVVNQNPIWNT